MKKIFVVIGIIILGYLIYKSFFKYPYRYIGYFYPDIENMDNWVESGPLKSLNNCQNWVNEMISKYKLYNSKNYDYECGKNCYKGDPYNQGGIYTCNTSVK